jgi:hypothetical protein
VSVQSPAVAEPTGVRYAWAGFPELGLSNAEGLPATPFCHPPVDFAAGARAGAGK